MRKKLFYTILIFPLFIQTLLFADFKETNALLDAAKKEVGEIEPKKLKFMLDNEKPVILLDVREVKQRAEGQIYADDSYEITRGNLEFKVLSKIRDKNALIVTYCKVGHKSVLAAQTLRRLGYKNATNLKGGIKAWANAGYPIETGLGVTVLLKK